MNRAASGRRIFGWLLIPLAVLVLPVLAVVVWSYALRPRDVHVVAVEVLKIGNTPELADVDRVLKGDPVLRVTFTAAENFNTYDRHHDTGTTIFAYPCSWTTRDDYNDDLFLSWDLYDRFGKVGLHEIPNGKSATTDKPPYAYHFYSSLTQISRWYRAYDFVHHPEDICFEVFGSGNLLSYGQHLSGIAPWFESGTYMIPKGSISDAIARAHIR